MPISTLLYNSGDGTAALKSSYYYYDKWIDSVTAVIVGCADEWIDFSHEHSKLSIDDCIFFSIIHGLSTNVPTASSSAYPWTTHDAEF